MRTFTLFKYHRCTDNSKWFLSFYFAVKELLITKNSVVKIQNLVVNLQSRPVKSHLAYIYICMYTLYILYTIYIIYSIYIYIYIHIRVSSIHLFLVDDISYYFSDQLSNFPIVSTLPWEIVILYFGQQELF